MPQNFQVNWTIFGCIDVEADSADAARELVRRMSFMRLANFGCPDYELEVIDVAGSPGSGGGVTAHEIRELIPKDSMAELFGE